MLQRGEDHNHGRHPTYLTLKEASARLGVHPNTLRNWEQRGLVRLARLPGSRYRRVPVYEVQRLAREMEDERSEETSWSAEAKPVETGRSHQVIETDRVRIELPSDDPMVIAKGRARAEEIKAKLAKVELQGTLEEAMRELRGYTDWLEWGESPRATKTQPTHGASWSVRIEPPDTDPEAIAAGQALAREIQEMLAQSEPEQTLEEVMQSLRGWSWS